MSDNDATRWIVHNVIAHPLLILCPLLGRWLHDRTAPPIDWTQARHGPPIATEMRFLKRERDALLAETLREQVLIDELRAAASDSGDAT